VAEPVSHEPAGQQTPPSGWDTPPDAGAPRSPEELLLELIDLFRKLLAVAQILLDLAEERVGRSKPSGGYTVAQQEIDIPIL
jgi:hypothetical protein